MINLIILILIIVIGIILLKYDDIREFFGVMSIILGIVTLIIHLIGWLHTPIDFDSFVAKHNQLQIDLDNARSSEDSYERVAILQQITEHNQFIAEKKVLNKNWFHDQYIDDRVDSLETIK